MSSLSQRLRRLITSNRHTPVHHAVSRKFGFDRGTPIDRYYIEQFVKDNAHLIRGRTLEVGDDLYSRKFGKPEIAVDILGTDRSSSKVSIIGNLETGQGLQSNYYDCLLLTQVFPFIYNVENVIQHCRNILKVGGALISTQPGISQISRFDMDRWGDFWRFTQASIYHLFSRAFGESNFKITIFGNVDAACCFLRGYAAEELESQRLDLVDEDYPITIGVVALKTHDEYI